MKGKIPVIFCIFFLSGLLVFSEESPFKDESRFILSGFSVPPLPTYLKELPLEQMGDFPLNVQDSGSLWIFVFLEDTHPLYRETKRELLQAQESWDIDSLKTAFISSQGEDDFRDPGSSTERMLGFALQPGIVIIDSRGKVLAWATGMFPDWMDENFVTALQESTL